MTRPMLLSEFTRLPLAWRASVVAGLSAAIDAVAVEGPASHAFLRYQWFAAALSAYGGAARTVLVASDAGPGIALPLIATGPGWLRAATVPGCYWPFRSFPASTLTEPAAWTTLADALAGAVNALRIGPVYDGDPSVAPLIDAMRARGWAVIDRFVADSFLLDIAAQRAAGSWPRGSTLRKNRFHEKHLAAHGALDWQYVDAGDWTDAAFDALAQVEQASWIAERTDGSDAKFTATGHGAFWRAAAGDPAIAAMFHAALLRVDGAPAAFSFDLDAGAVKYAIANSYDPAFAKHSPGKLLYYRNLVVGVARGIDRVDWGAGDSGYKRTIGAAPGPAIRDWLLLRPGVPALAGRLLRGWWRRSGNWRVMTSARSAPNPFVSSEVEKRCLART